MAKKSIAFFDVDETLVDGNSGYYTTLRLVRHGILKKRRLFQAIYYSLANLFSHQDVHKIYRIAIADMAGMTLEHAFEIGRECLEKDIKPRLYSKGIEQIRQHKEAGDVVILLTSGPYMTIQPLSEYLGVDGFHASGPKIENGILINELQLPLCYGEDKLHYAEESCRKYNIPLSACTFYSNDITDLKLLEKVKYPCAVNPHKDLEKIAKERGWPVLRFDVK
ncbi:MAG: HAD-IB family hydrolase [Deltaproteobacteria bacterium]|nr:HAD-IB family hydrolase [Deltaproteobacteria bacterium]